MSEHAFLPWIRVAPTAPYFLTEEGQPWTPIGQNDAITWPDLAGLFQRRNLAAVEGHFAWLAAHGVTCLRLMLEYCQTEHRYLERPVGRFQPHMVQLWDDLFALCAKAGLRVLLTPFDTYWMGRRWRHHPYHQAHGGPGTSRTQWLRCPRMRAAIKNRLTFAAERWGGSGVLFAWDLWNELPPARATHHAAGLADFMHDVSQHLRAVETRCFGRAHLQTVSVFGPLLAAHPGLDDLVFRHPDLDFATSHFYDAATISRPKNALDPALQTAALVHQALAQLPANRPFLDSEHGPLDTFKSGRQLPEAFDDEYFRCMQWAHLAAGGVGGGLRWPYRSPHVLTQGMRAAQRSLAGFVNLLNWAQFQRGTVPPAVQLSTTAVQCIASGDAHQAVVWLVRPDALTTRAGRPRPLEPLAVQLTLPGLAPGRYRVYVWDTKDGHLSSQLLLQADQQHLVIRLPALHADVALAVVPAP
ncbi:hypothetical protein [Hymenobacter sp. HDW8]|uniref:hypothetical protein n=1 Tax=Hymenobacter sp. HDW8 TaxID=2714932 RepID=UPI00140D03C6|nr:hypothetical protein [Hymenobacter sp. HDW8]QIL78301.1 hypothetical protein G7064_21000 [Hymenobacter sp. HDW8]